MKQTAVEWLVSQLQKSKDWQRVLNEVRQMSTIEFNLIEKAKEMEKQQLYNFYMQRGVDAIMEADRNVEQYYNETFKSE